MIASSLVLCAAVSLNVEGLADPISPTTVAAMKHATTLIEISQKGKLLGSGTGFLVYADAQGGIVVTNHHVVQPILKYIRIEEKRPPPSARDPIPSARDPLGRDPFNRDPFNRNPLNRNPFGNMPDSPANRAARNAEARLRELERSLDFGKPGRAREPEPEYSIRVVTKSIKDADVAVVFDSGCKEERVVPAELLVADTTRDLAVLRVKGTSFPPPLDVKPTTQLFETLPIYSFGFPFGKNLSVSKGRPAITVGTGTVSSLRQNNEGELAEIQIDGNLNPGNSGGPIVDAQGRLVGVAKAIVREGPGIGFVVPADDLRKTITGRSGDCFVSAKKDGDKLNVALDLEIIDPLAKVTAAKLLCLPASKGRSLKEPVATLEGVAGVVMVAMTLEKPQAHGKLTLDSADEAELFVQAVVEVGEPAPVAAKVVRKSLVPAPMFVEATPKTTPKETIPKETIPKETTPGETTPKEMPRKESPRKETPRKERPSRTRIEKAKPEPDKSASEPDKMVEAREQSKKLMDEAKKRAQDMRIRSSSKGKPGPDGATEIVGGTFEQPLRDEGPEGSMLIGLELGRRKFGRGDLLGAVRPIYRTANGEVKGEARGTDFSRMVELKAKKGYAVGGASIRGGLILNGLSLRFMKIKGDKLDPNDAYDSEWAGDRTGGRELQMTGDGEPVIGIAVRMNRDNCNGLGLLYKRGQATETPKPDSQAKPMEPPKIESIFRKAAAATPEIAGGGSDDLPFRDEAPSGALLIGFEVGVRAVDGKDMIGAIRPVFLTSAGERRGAPHGEDFSKKVVAKAKPGYAVGGVVVRSGKAVDALKVRFMRVRGSRLDANDAYESDWIGNSSAGTETRYGGDGAPVVGVVGRADDKFCTGLGLVIKRQ